MYPALILGHLILGSWAHGEMPGPARVNSGDHELLMRPPPNTCYSDRLTGGCVCSDPGGTDCFDAVVCLGPLKT